MSLRTGARSEEDGKFPASLERARRADSEGVGAGVPCLSGHADPQASQSQRELRRRVGQRRGRARRQQPHGAQDGLGRGVVGDDGPHAARATTGTPPHVDTEGADQRGGPVEPRTLDDGPRRHVRGDDGRRRGSQHDGRAQACVASDRRPSRRASAVTAPPGPHLRDARPETHHRRASRPRAR